MAVGRRLRRVVQPQAVNIAKVGGIERPECGVVLERRRPRSALRELPHALDGLVRGALKATVQAKAGDLFDRRPCLILGF